jgi:hypothetical protein
LILGFIVGHRGIETNPAKVDAIRNMAMPSNKKDIMKLTGMMATLGRFISKLGEKGLPFFKLLKKADKFVWDDKAQKAFEALKESLTTPPVMTPPVTGETMDAYCAEIRKLEGRFEGIEFQHIPRNNNNRQACSSKIYASLQSSFWTRIA